jgi:hypothetical protein
LFDDQILTAIGPLRAVGFALHWLHPKSKRPIGDDWSTKPVLTADQLTRRHAAGNNLGVRLGEPSRLIDGNYQHAIDLDIRDESQAAAAHAALDELFPGAIDSLPVVRSGSGGSSRHLYFTTDRPFASKKLACSAGFKMVPDPKLGRDVKKRDWEIELFGTGKQVVLPPSIHPDTGLPYAWERPFDLDSLAIGVSPFIASSHLDSLGIIDAAQRAEDAKPPLGLTDDEIQDILDAPCRSRNTARTATGGCRSAWRCTTRPAAARTATISGANSASSRRSSTSASSARSGTASSRRPNSVRMASLKAVVNEQRLMEQFDEVPLDDGNRRRRRLIGAVRRPSQTSSTASSAARRRRSRVDFADGPERGGRNPPDPPQRQADRPQRPAASSACRRSTSSRRKPCSARARHKEPTAARTRRSRRLAARGPHLGRRGHAERQLWSDDRDFAIRSVIEAPRTQGGYGIKVSDRDLKAAIVIAANDHAFHPVREYLDGLKWDGKPRVERLFVDYLGGEPNAYTLSVARLMMTAP